MIGYFLAKHFSRRRARRDTFTSSDLLMPHGSNPNFNHSGRGSPSSTSPIPISHSFPNHSTHSSSQPTPTGYRRIYSPLTIDSSHIAPFDSSARRYSASAAVSPPTEVQNLHLPPILHLIPPSPQQAISQETMRKFTDRQWHIPIFSYSCSKSDLAGSLLRTNEQYLSTACPDSYVDCTKDETESTNGTIVTTLSSLKGRKRGRSRAERRSHGSIFELCIDNSRRHDEDIPHDKQADDMRNSLDYAFATGRSRSSLLKQVLATRSVAFSILQKLSTRFDHAPSGCRIRSQCDLPRALRRHRPDGVSQSHVHAFKRGSSSPVSSRGSGRDVSSFVFLERSVEPSASCDPTTLHIHSYLNNKFLEILGKNFHRVSPDSDYFYFCSDEERSRQSRTSLELEDRLATANNEMTPTASGPYKFDETNGDDRESETNDDDDRQDQESVGTVLVHDTNDDDELELNMHTSRRRSDVSSSSLSNRSRDLSGRGELLPLFLCFSCRFVMRDMDYIIPMKNIPLCISTSTDHCLFLSLTVSLLAQLIPNTNDMKLDMDNQRVSSSNGPDIKLDLDQISVSFSLICITFGREDVDSQGTSIGVLTTSASTFNHPFLSAKRYAELNALEPSDNNSTCTGTTMVGDINRHDRPRAVSGRRMNLRLEIHWIN